VRYTTSATIPQGSNRQVFEAELARQTGLDPAVIHAWVSAESGNERYGTAPAGSNQNWLNIGFFDSGPGKLAYSQAFADPKTAADYTARFMRGSWGGASPGIRSILNTVGQSAQHQIAAIGSSGWATNPQYGSNILALFNHPGPYVAPDPNSLSSIVGQVAGAAGQTASTIGNAATSVPDFLGKLSDPRTWLRVAMALGAIILLTFGLFELAGHGDAIRRAPKRAAMAAAA
jgi:hypothetical protein